MRDIVGRPRPSEKPPTAQADDFVQLVIPDSTEPPLLEKLAGRVNEWGGNLSRFSVLKRANRKKTAHQFEAPTPLATTAERVKKTRMPRGVVAKTIRATRGAGKVIRRELRKPGRKTGLVHTLALGTLFAIIISGGAEFKTRAVKDDTTNPTTAVRRYLPSISNNSQSTALDAGKALLSSGHSINLYGWITPWNVQSGTNQQFTAASAFWLTVGSDGASFVPQADWSIWQNFRQQQGISETYLTVSGDPNITFNVLSNTDLQSRHIAGLLSIVQAQGFSGIDIDYEGLGAENRELFTSFVRNLSTVFHQQGKKVAVTLESRIANQVPMDWHAVGQLADEVRIMAYDYHSRTTNQPGPVAPLAWVAEVVSYASSQIPSQKLVIGLGNYGYDWSAPLTQVDSWEGSGVSYEQAMNLSTTQNTPVIRRTGIDDRGYDIGTIPNFGYTDTQGRQHQVWFEDAASLQDKVNTVAAYNIKGVMFWSVGAGDPAFWQNHS